MACYSRITFAERLDEALRPMGLSEAALSEKDVEGLWLSYVEGATWDDVVEMATERIRGEV